MAEDTFTDSAGLLHHADGRFAQGNAGGPGRPPRPADERWVERLKAVVTDEDIDEIILEAVRRAKLGQWRARDFLWSYGIGKPRQMVEVSGGDMPMMRLFLLWLQGKDADLEARMLGAEVAPADIAALEAEGAEP